jgi:hypothetical protein
MYITQLHIANTAQWGIDSTSAKTKSVCGSCGMRANGTYLPGTKCVVVARHQTLRSETPRGCASTDFVPATLAPMGFRRRLQLSNWKSRGVGLLSNSDIITVRMW